MGIVAIYINLFIKPLGPFTFFSSMANLAIYLKKPEDILKTFQRIVPRINCVVPCVHVRSYKTTNFVC